jgi:hypothetical protein
MKSHSHRLATMTLLEEASRYALLRRITPTLRHHMAGEFQPIGMMAALVERRAQHPSPDMTGLKDNCAALGKLSRNAAESCANLMNWVAPRAPAQMALAEAITECVNLLSTSLRFRGFALSSELPAMRARVSCTAVRSVLTAAILTLSDTASEPADLHVSAQVLGEQALITLSLTPVDRPADNHGGEDYRALTWDDVAALAQAESVEVTHALRTAQLKLPAQTA